jgi:hypothetical protein
LRGLFEDSGRQIFLICLGCVIVGSVHVVFGCHLFLKLSKTDISENLRVLARISALQLLLGHDCVAGGS